MKDKTYEVCPYCGEEVELDAEFKVQKCTKCGRAIPTCSMCEALSDGVANCCRNCPLEYLAHKANEEEEKKNTESYEVILHLDADIDEHIVAGSAREALDSVLEKYRNMTDDELFKHICYFRNVSNAVVYSDKTGVSIIGGEEHKL